MLLKTETKITKLTFPHFVSLVNFLLRLSVTMNQRASPLPENSDVDNFLYYFHEHGGIYF